MSAQLERYRCSACGNRTRFDVYETVRRRRYHHLTLGGEVTVDEEEILERTLERVVCRWCDRSDTIEPVTETDAAAADQAER